MSTVEALFSFRGRIRRQDWWVWTWSLILTHICLAFSILMFLEPKGLETAPRAVAYILGAASDLPMGLRTVLDAIFLWPVLALGVKRLHDQGRAGWSVVALNAFSFSIIRVPKPWLDWFDDSVPSLAGLAMLVVILGASLWVLLLLAFNDGTPGPNRYGPSPKADERAATT